MLHAAQEALNPIANQAKQASYSFSYRVSNTIAHFCNHQALQNPWITRHPYRFVTLGSFLWKNTLLLSAIAKFNPWFLVASVALQLIDLALFRANLELTSRHRKFVAKRFNDMVWREYEDANLEYGFGLIFDKENKRPTHWEYDLIHMFVKRHYSASFYNYHTTKKNGVDQTFFDYIKAAHLKYIGIDFATTLGFWLCRGLIFSNPVTAAAIFTALFVAKAVNYYYFNKAISPDTYGHGIIKDSQKPNPDDPEKPIQVYDPSQPYGAMMCNERTIKTPMFYKRSFIVTRDDFKEMFHFSKDKKNKSLKGYPEYDDKEDNFEVHVPDAIIGDLNAAMDALFIKDQFTPNFSTIEKIRQAIKEGREKYEADTLKEEDDEYKASRLEFYDKVTDRVFNDKLRPFCNKYQHGFDFGEFMNSFGFSHDKEDILAIKAEMPRYLAKAENFPETIPQAIIDKLNIALEKIFFEDANKHPKTFATTNAKLNALRQIRNDYRVELRQSLGHLNNKIYQKIEEDYNRIVDARIRKLERFCDFYLSKLDDKMYYRYVLMSSKSKEELDHAQKGGQLTEDKAHLQVVLKDPRETLADPYNPDITVLRYVEIPGWVTSLPRVLLNDVGQEAYFGLSKLNNLKSLLHSFELNLPFHATEWFSKRVKLTFEYDEEANKITIKRPDNDSNIPTNTPSAELKDLAKGEVLAAKAFENSNCEYESPSGTVQRWMHRLGNAYGVPYNLIDMYKGGVVKALNKWNSIGTGTSIAQGWDYRAEEFNKPLNLQYTYPKNSTKWFASKPSSQSDEEDFKVAIKKEIAKSYASTQQRRLQ